MRPIERIQFLTHDIEGFSHAEQARKACMGGIKWIQFRTKSLTGEAYVTEAIKVKDICKEFDAVFILNDRVELVKEIGMDGVHLGKTDMAVSEARRILGQDAIIGGTANTSEDINHLLSEGVNYIGLGPFKYTCTKQKLSPVLGLERILEISNRYKSIIPVICIGGITLEDAKTLMENGAYGLAVSSAIAQSSNPELSAKQFCNFTKKQLEWNN
jgi:thiamine-phosphate pyrophosphorylase